MWEPIFWKNSFLSKVVHFFCKFHHLICWKTVSNQNICNSWYAITNPIPGKILFMSYGLKCSLPIKLQDSSMANFLRRERDMNFLCLKKTRIDLGISNGHGQAYLGRLKVLIMTNHKYVKRFRDVKLFFIF